MKNNAPKDKKTLTAVIISIFAFISIFIAVVLNMESIYYNSDSKDGFPISFTSNDVINIKPMNSDVAVLTGKSLGLYSEHGKEKFTFNFTFSEPSFSTEGDFGVVFDRRSDKYIYFNSRGNQVKGKTEDGSYIYTAEVDSKGNLFIVTKSENTACKLYIYDRNINEQFAWACGDEYIVSLDSDPSSGRILCGAIGAFNGEVCTKAYLLDIKENEPVVREYTVGGSACLEVSLISDRAIITCNNKRVVYNTNKKDDNGTEIEFFSDAIAFDSDLKGNTAIITDAPSAEKGEYCLSLYNKKGTLVFASYFDGKAQDICCENERVYLLDGFSVHQFGADGDEKTSYELKKKGFGIMVNGSDVYCRALGGVEKAVR